MPRTGCQTPTISLASEDLPAALGPMMPRPSPLLSVKATSCKTTRLSPGGLALTDSTERDVSGFGSGNELLALWQQSQEFSKASTRLPRRYKALSNWRWQAQPAQARAT